MKRHWVEVGAGRWMLVDDEPKIEAPSKGPFVRNEHLSARAKRALYLQTGKHFDSESAARVHMKANNMRFIEKGEGADRRRDWVRNTKPGDRGRYPHTNHLGYGIA